MARDRALAHDHSRFLRWVLGLGACGCLVALAAVALVLLSSGDAHGVELGPLKVPVESPVPTPVDPLVDAVDRHLTVSPTPAPTPSTPAPVEAQPLGSVLEPVGSVVEPVVGSVRRNRSSVRWSSRCSVGVEPVLGTVGSVVEPVLGTVGSVVEPVSVGRSVVEPVLGTVGSVVEPVVGSVLDTTAPVVEQTNPVLPSSQLPLPPAPGDVTGAQPFAIPDQTSLAMPPRLPRAFAGLASAMSANVPADEPGGSSTPSPVNGGSPVLPQPMRPSTSTSTSIDTAHGLQLLLFAIAAALAAFALTRGRRLLPFGAVMPRYAFVSLIERPG